MNIKTYCINLDRRPDRWQLAQEQFKKHGLEVERFRAIDGNVKGITMSITPQSACSYSHMEVINAAEIYKFPYVMIFEDDVVLHEKFTEQLRIVFYKLPKDWDLLYLGGSHREKPEPINSHIYKVTHTLTTHAYIIRNTMYETAYRYLFLTTDPPDCVFVPLQKRFNCYVTNPPLAWQRKGFSDIEGREMDYPWLQTNDQ